LINGGQHAYQVVAVIHKRKSCTGSRKKLDSKQRRKSSKKQHRPVELSIGR
jgi:hypothetical protein